MGVCVGDHFGHLLCYFFASVPCVSVSGDMFVYEEYFHLVRLLRLKAS